LVELRAFAQGCVFEIVAAARRDEQPYDQWFGNVDKQERALFSGHPSDRFPDEVLRVSAQFPDGSKAVSPDRKVWSESSPQPPDGPVLVPLRGHVGSAGRDILELRQSLWIRPLPPPESFDLVVEWPAAGITLTRHTVNGAAIVEAARQATPYW
jgi:hypothetical protein